MDLIPFNLTTFTISNLKPIVYKYSYFCDTTNANLIEPWVLHLFDCNGIEIGDISFYLPFKTNSPEEDSEFNDDVNFLYTQIIYGCIWWLEECSDYINSDLFYMHINKIKSI